MVSELLAQLLQVVGTAIWIIILTKYCMYIPNFGVKLAKISLDSSGLDI